MEVLYEVRGENLLIYLPEELDHHNAKTITEQSDWYIVSNQIKNIIFNSYEKNDIIISSDAKDALYGLRQFLFENVYFSNNLVIEREKYSNILSKMYEFYMSDFSKIPQEFMNIYINYDISNKKSTIICDYIAGMTDRFAITTYNNLFLK